LTFILTKKMQRNALALRRGTINLTVVMAVSKFKALGFRARARRAKTKYRKQIESDDRRWGGRRLKLSGRAVIPIPAGRIFKDCMNKSAFFEFFHK